MWQKLPSQSVALCMWLTVALWSFEPTTPGQLLNAWWWYQCLRRQPTRGQDVVGATALESVTVSIQVWMVFLINFGFSYSSLGFGAQGRYLSLMAEFTIKSSSPSWRPHCFFPSWGWLIDPAPAYLLCSDLVLGPCQNPAQALCFKHCLPHFPCLMCCALTLRLLNAVAPYIGSRFVFAQLLWESFTDNRSLAHSHREPC